MHGTDTEACTGEAHGEYSGVGVLHSSDADEVASTGAADADADVHGTDADEATALADADDELSESKKLLYIPKPSFSVHLLT